MISQLYRHYSSSTPNECKLIDMENSDVQPSPVNDNYIHAMKLYEQRKTNTRSIMVAAAGGAAMVGGAALAAASSAPLVSFSGMALVVGGMSAELLGMIAFVKTA